jgi:hypothetical protein
MRGPCCVAAAAADDELPIGAAAGGDFLDVVGGQVGGLVGGLSCPAWAPVTDDGAVVGDDAGATASLCCVGVEVGASCSLGALVVTLAVVTAGFAADLAATADAGSEQVPHRGLRLRRSRSLSRHLGQRSPGPTNLVWQPTHEPWGRPANRVGRALPTAPGQGEQGQGGACAALVTHAHNPRAGVGGHSHDCHVVECCLGPCHPATIG